MALVVETGAGIVNAASYATIAVIDAYWAARTHMTIATAWTVATTAHKEGAAREATNFIDATYGSHYKGERKGYVQGLLWPRTGAGDEVGYPLPDLPPELVQAVCELAGRAVSERLSADADLSGSVKRYRKKIGQIDKEFEFVGGAGSEKKYGIVSGILTPILDGSQPGAAAKWSWK